MQRGVQLNYLGPYQLLKVLRIRQSDQSLAFLPTKRRQILYPQQLLSPVALLLIAQINHSNGIRLESLGLDVGLNPTIYEHLLKFPATTGT